MCVCVPFSYLLLSAGKYHLLKNKERYIHCILAGIPSRGLNGIDSLHTQRIRADDLL